MRIDRAQRRPISTQYYRDILIYCSTLFTYTVISKPKAVIVIEPLQLPYMSYYMSRRFLQNITINWVLRIIYARLECNTIDEGNHFVLFSFEKYV